MYLFKIEKKEELLKGKSVKEVADVTGSSRTNLSNILSGITKTSKLMAYCLVKICDEDKEIDYYFTRLK